MISSDKDFDPPAVSIPNRPAFLLFLCPILVGIGSAPVMVSVFHGLYLGC